MQSTALLIKDVFLVLGCLLGWTDRTLMLCVYEKVTTKNRLL